ncbi:MAG TPA: phosphoribosylaminoimidazolesuccinocarboxamide synthase [Acidiferrobacterales bacterium]|nr:phosphoribosylaminoimidazolesuccinocarboxamide synthase [Acidiferrobacterales bacterium]
MEKPVSEINIPELPLFKKGKVRDVYDLGDRLLIVASDRISAFDFVLPSLIPNKGKILTQLSRFWFDFTAYICPNHVLQTEFRRFPQPLQKYKSILDKRSMLVKKTRVVPIECVVRGYLSGSGWKEYQETGKTGGVKLPAGLRESDRLPNPIFAPSTKAEEGHDLNISFKEMKKIVGDEELAQKMKKTSLKLFQKASLHALSKGIIIADTKFEFGLDEQGTLTLIDEVLTPDSSRFWPADQYQPGANPPSFDKQYVRDWLEASGWNKKPPAPKLPPEVIARTAEKYREALTRLTS